MGLFSRHKKDIQQKNHAPHPIAQQDSFEAAPTAQTAPRTMPPSHKLAEDSGLFRVVEMMRERGTGNLTLELKQTGNDMNLTLLEDGDSIEEAVVLPGNDWFDGVADLYLDEEKNGNGPFDRATIVVHEGDDYTVQASFVNTEAETSSHQQYVAPHMVPVSESGEPLFAVGSLSSNPSELTYSGEAVVDDEPELSTTNAALHTEKSVNADERFGRVSQKISVENDSTSFRPTAFGGPVESISAPGARSENTEQPSAQEAEGQEETFQTETAQDPTYGYRSRFLAKKAGFESQQEAVARQDSEQAQTDTEVADEDNPFVRTTDSEDDGAAAVVEEPAGVEEREESAVADSGVHVSRHSFGTSPVTAARPVEAEFEGETEETGVPVTGAAGTAGAVEGENSSAQDELYAAQQSAVTDSGEQSAPLPYDELSELSTGTHEQHSDQGAGPHDLEDHESSFTAEESFPASHAEDSEEIESAEYSVDSAESANSAKPAEETALQEEESTARAERHSTSDSAIASATLPDHIDDVWEDESLTQEALVSPAVSERHRSSVNDLPDSAATVDVAPSFSTPAVVVQKPSETKLAEGNLVLTEAQVVKRLTAAQNALFGLDGSARDVSTVLIRIRTLGSYYDALTHVRQGGFWDQKRTFDLIPEDVLNVLQLKSDSYKEGFGSPLSMSIRFTPGIPPVAQFDYSDEGAFAKYSDELPAQQYVEELRMFPRTGSNIPAHMSRALASWTL